MTVPGWWETTLLALAAWRTWKLLAEDSILDRLRRYVTGKARELLECPWCLGAHLAVAWWLAFSFYPEVTTIAAIPFALSALVGVIAWFTSD